MHTHTLGRLLKETALETVSCSVMSDSLQPHGSMDCSLPGSSVHEILQGRILEWVAIAFSDDFFRYIESEYMGAC